MKLKGYRVVFTAKHNIASSVRGDIALDDIELTPGKCKDTKRGMLHNCALLMIMTVATLHQGLAFLIGNGNHNLNQLLISELNQTVIIHLELTQTAILSSPVYKKPKSALNCLHFYFYIDGDGSSWLWGSVREAYIQAHINYPSSKAGIQFTAGLNTPVEALVAIDDIKLFSGNCPEAELPDLEEDKCADRWQGQYNWIRKVDRPGLMGSLNFQDKTKINWTVNIDDLVTISSNHI
ncbi:MAM and LDL-receptor class A domain-containing protein 2 [Caerostris extrusa]|uniref:MAM and LDL-receptor class A domain-containing protein 2 n=1 Tax=Caerostris extrusa TaxID=172846 RepID=A0AAV4R3G0_CAEEX|nr:MAM and LDL-receptor class A domain-containing protein 2 [Caerostris extrusa]